MKSKPALVDLTELRTLMMGVELGDTKRNEYINARWLKYVEWWDFRASMGMSSSSTPEGARPSS